MKVRDRVKELKQKTVDELQQELRGLLREWFNLRMQKGTQQLNQHHQFKRVRRDIARVKTIMTEKGMP